MPSRRIHDIAHVITATFYFLWYQLGEASVPEVSSRSSGDVIGTLDVVSERGLPSQ